MEFQVIWTLLSFTAFIIYLFLGFYVWKADSQVKLNRQFWFWTLAMAEATFCGIFLYPGSQKEIFAFWEKSAAIGSVIQNGILFHIVLILIHRNRPLKKRWLFLLYAPGVLVILFIIFLRQRGALLFPTSVNGMRSLENLYCYGLSIASVFLVGWWGCHATLQKEKKQARIFMIAGLITFALCLANDYPPPGIRWSAFDPASQIIILILAISIWYGIVKYKIPVLVSLVKIGDVVDKVTDLIFVIDLNMQIVDCNHRVLEKLGYSKIEIFNGPSARIIQGNIANMLDEYNYQRIAVFNEIYCLDKSGNSIPVSLQVSAICDQAGDTAGFLLVCQDRTLINRLQSEIDYRIQKEEQLKYLSQHDPVTGLFNRTRFEQELITYETYPLLSAGIIICDIDGLKLVNDTLGHNAGDQLLLAAGQALQKSFRNQEIVARIGGDEFAVLIPAGDRLLIKNAYQNVREAIAEFNQNNSGLHLSLSMGYACADNEAKKIIDLFKEADNYMYKEKLNHEKSARNGMIQALMKTLEARDFITEGHTERIQELLVELGDFLRLPESQITNLRLLGQFHDIGKVGIPDRILFKTGPLNDAEMSEMRRHSDIGYRIAIAIPDLNPIADLIWRHHERWDGNGYPLGLQGEQIPLECRILAVADAFDAMTNNRPYRQALSFSDAVIELEKNAGSQFDPGIVTQFLALLFSKESPTQELA